ncbi:hypothetical protein [Paenibacillus sp. KR2-11]|uniref:hypothetical protein n=1 Tax=Paenibacillus sp. KR2-11 TaxID=3385500 RepID=UPI0038FC6BF6
MRKEILINGKMATHVEISISVFSRDLLERIYLSIQRNKAIAEAKEAEKKENRRKRKPTTGDSAAAG